MVKPLTDSFKLSKEILYAIDHHSALGHLPAGYAPEQLILILVDTYSPKTHLFNVLRLRVILNTSKKTTQRRHYE